MHQPARKPWRQSWNSIARNHSLPCHHIITLDRYHLPPSLHPPSPTALTLSSMTLAAMATHINQIHGIHLLGNHILPLKTRGEEIDIEISKKQRFAPLQSLLPCLTNVAQCSTMIRGWDVCSHDKIPCLPMTNSKVITSVPHAPLPWSHRVHVSPEEGNPSLMGADCIGSYDFVATQKASVCAVSGIDLCEDAQIYPHCCHHSQSTLQT